MKKISLFVLISFSASLLNAQQKTCREVLGVAESFLIDGNTDNVRKILNQTKNTCGDDVSWYYIQYGYQLAVNQADSALHFSKIGVKKFQQADSLHLLYAQACLMTYDSSLAVDGLNAIDKALKLKKKSSYLVCKMQLLHVANRGPEAMKIFIDHPGLEKNYDALVEFGSLLIENTKYKDALAYYNRAKKIDPFSPVVYLHKAELFFIYLNNQDAGLAALDTVEMIDSTLADPMLMRAEFFESVQDYDNAIAEYDEAIQTDSSIHQVYILRGSCLKEIKEYDLAEADYNTYKKKNPSDHEINYMMADLYIAKGDYNAAAMLMSQMETKGNSDYELYLTRGIAYNNNGQYDDALKDFNKAENFKERDVDLYYNRGMCYFNKGDFRKAKYDFEKAKNMIPDNMEFWYLHCRAAFEAGHTDEACESCKTAKFHGYEGVDSKYMKGCK